MSVKLLTEHHLEVLSLKEGCTDLSESTLVKMPHFRKSHVTAHYYVVGTQKNRLNETVILSTQNICLDCWLENNYNFTLKKLA